MACTTKESPDFYDYQGLDYGQVPNVTISGTLEGAQGVVAFALNQIPHRKVFKKDGDKYILKAPLYLDSAVLPVPDSLSIKIFMFCRNEVVPKMKVKVESEFLIQSPLESEVEFNKCVNGATNKFFYVKIKNKQLPEIQIDSVSLIFTPAIQ